MSLIRLKTKAIRLRKQGYSLQEISKKLLIAKSTASLWLRTTPLSQRAKERLQKRYVYGIDKAVQTKKKNKRLRSIFNYKKGFDTISSITFSKDLAKIYCALLWWCEGNKNESFVRFTSSDKTLIENYLFVFRHAFPLDESKFRALVHLHSYHNDEVQKTYWSKITKIPLTQFYNSYKKMNTGKRKHENYAGCIAITYYDSKIENELEAIYNAFTRYHSGGVR